VIIFSPSKEWGVLVCFKMADFSNEERESEREESETEKENAYEKKTETLKEREARRGSRKRKVSQMVGDEGAKRGKVRSSERAPAWEDDEAEASGGGEEDRTVKVCQ
jgi:hypothetical protein